MVLDLIIFHAVVAFLGALLVYMIVRTIFDGIMAAWRLVTSQDH